MSDRSSVLGAFKTFSSCVESSEQMGRVITGGNLHGFATCVHNCCKVWKRNEAAFVREFHQHQSFQLLINRISILMSPQPVMVVVLALQDICRHTEDLKKELGL